MKITRSAVRGEHIRGRTIESRLFTNSVGKIVCETCFDAILKSNDDESADSSTDLTNPRSVASNIDWMLGAFGLATILVAGSVKVLLPNDAYRFAANSHGLVFSEERPTTFQVIRFLIS
jgi:hypothetical protein